MLGIEIRASGVTLSTGERIEFPAGAAPSDLLFRIEDDAPYVRVSGSDSVGSGHEVIAAAALYADLLADALRADALDAEDMELSAQLRLAGPLQLAIPGWWTPPARARFSAALHERGLRATLVNGAEAAVHGHVASGATLAGTVAVIRATGGSVSLVLVQNCDSHPQALLSPTALIREGGDALDAAVLRHLLEGLESMGDVFDRADAHTISAAREALAPCRELRESLTLHATAAFEPPVPGATHRVLLTRSELDELAAPWLDTVLTQISAALERSSWPAQTVLLTGGLATMPVLAHRLSAQLGLDVHVADGPTTVTARGAEALALPARAAKRGWRALWPFRENVRDRELVNR